MSRLVHSTVFRLTLGVILFGIVFLALAEAFEFSEVVAAVRRFPLAAMPILLLSAFLVNVLKGIRFHILVRHAGIHIHFWRTLRLFLASQAATPIPAGETIRAALLKQETGASLGKVAGPVFGQAVYEIAAAAVIVLIASGYYPELLVPALVAVVSICVLIWLLLQRSVLYFVLAVLAKLPAVYRATEKIKAGHEHFRKNFALLGDEGFDRHVFAAIITALLAQLMGGLLVVIAAHAFGIPLNFFQATLVYACGAILQGLFTLIPAGLGVTEGGMSGVLHLLGIELSLAFALVIIIRLVTLLFPVALGLVLFVIFYARRAFFVKQLPSLG